MENNPINEQMCSRLLGIPVCAVLHDGTRHYGIVGKVGGGKLILNDNQEHPESSGAAKKTKSKAKTSVEKKAAASRRNRRIMERARLSAFPDEETEQSASPFPNPFSERVALDLTSIAALIPLL